MKYISHRGNYSGSIPERENKPSYIDTALSMGFDVEIDIRYLKGNYYLGHDFPETIVTENWIITRKNNLWIHCKNIEAAVQLSKIGQKINYFCHSSDDFVIISNEYIWVHNLSCELNKKCIIPLLNEDSIKSYRNYDNVYAICTDFLNLTKI